MGNSRMSDDWREETQTRLPKSLIYKTLKLKCDKDPTGSHVMSLVDEAVYYAYQRTKTVLRHMGEFTLHDGEHLFRVLRLMEKLVPKNTIDKFTVPECMLLILSAFFHDIGMAPSERDVLAWKKFWDSSPDFSDPAEEKEYLKFKRYCFTKEDKLLHIKMLEERGKHSLAETMQGYIISEYIRSTHSERAREIIEQDWNEKIKYRDTDLTVEFAEICFSHSDDTTRLLELDTNHLCGPDVSACLPIVAVILRLADILDFDGKRTPSILFSHLSVRHPISLLEWNKHRAVDAWQISEKDVCYQAKCTHPAIEESIHGFCDLIDRELSACNNVMSRVNETLKNNKRDIELRIPLKVDRAKIQTKKTILGEPLYLYRRTKFDLSKEQVVDLLMGTKLYANPEVALRELLQNSIDACLLRKALEDEWSNSYTPEIMVHYYTDGEDNILQITDNGTGMDQGIIDRHYSKIGSSFYKSAEFFELKQEANADFIPTSRFGIGILSCFMVADTLEVDTRRVRASYDYGEPIKLVVEGQESIFLVKKGERKEPGTTTKLVLHKKNPWQHMTEDKFVEAVKKVIPNPPFKIIVKTETNETVLDEHSFKAINASSLEGYSWREHMNIRKIQIPLGNCKDDIVGSVVVGVLECYGKPAKEIEIDSKTVEIEGKSFELTKEAHIQSNEIILKSTSITIDDESEISVDDQSTSLVKSKSRMSLHGIEIPTTLFPNYWEKLQNQLCISWPFPMLIIVDICGKRDLDLNTSRTQIIMSDKWNNFEEDLAFIVCSGIKQKVTKEYWDALKSILLLKTDSNNFRAGLERVSV